MKIKVIPILILTGNHITIEIYTCRASTGKDFLFKVIMKLTTDGRFGSQIFIKM